jgi:hypothetical protein
MKNIHVIPTSSPSKIFYIAENFHLEKGQLIEPKSYHNVYITSDDYPLDGEISMVAGNHLNKFNSKFTSMKEVEAQWRKIILTTDPDLIADGVQAIDNEFLEWFVKNPSCESVVVNFNYKKFRWSELNKSQCYKIIIPQEESKQEIVINEKCSKCGSSQYQIGKPFCTDEFCNTNIGKASEDYWLKQPYNEDAFVEGAKWQQEQDKNKYSEEEVLEILFELSCNSDTDKEEVEEWFEQFKKK